MIDLLDFVIRIRHKPFGTVRLLKREGGTYGVTKHLSKKVSLFDDGALMLVTSIKNGTEIAIRCCPGKVLQGHNIFGTDYLNGLAIKLIEYVLAVLDLEADQAQWTAWKDGDFEIRAVDITYRFALDSHLLLSRLIAHLARTMPMKYLPTPICPGIGVRMSVAERRVEWLFYDKQLEFADKRFKEAKYLEALIGDDAACAMIEALLPQEASQNIRTELKLGSGFLQMNNLNTGSKWTKERVKEIYFEELKFLRLDAVPSIAHGKVLLDRLTDPKLRQTFLGWLCGEDLSTYGNPQTLRLRRYAILEIINIDILLDVMPLNDPPCKMADVFNVDNKLPDFPDWVTQYPAVAYKGRDLPRVRKKRES
ncbi:MAG: hypothetical protein JWQ21_638 [Herminiimonas sp.]|nr:hypothetical protein [Herminiimonas sp.]